MTQPAYDYDNTPGLLGLIERDAVSPERTLPNDVRLPPRLLQRALFEPLREAASRPGKELRARLLELAHALVGGTRPPAPELAGVVEALHLGSLIVDDIEDGSASRRGGPALHRLFGTPIALNVGNYLYFYAGAALLPSLDLHPRTELAVRKAVDRAVLGCHYGQALDLGVKVTELRRREVPDVVYGTTRLKTGSLMELAAELGALAGGAKPEHVTALRNLGSSVGVALQMLDDLSGITSERRCHKGHEDLLGGRASWPWAWLAERDDNVDYSRLRSLLESVVRRDLHPEVVAEQLRERIGAHGRAAVKQKLDGIRRFALDTFGASRTLSAFGEELARLERYDG
jgi:geranylgeranyl pyrophosphate synthase